MIVNISKQILTVIIFIILLQLYATAQFYKFGDSINPYYSWKNNYNGWYAQSPVSCNFTITGVIPQAFSSYTNTDSLEFQIFRIQDDLQDNGIQHPSDASLIPPQQTYYKGLQGANNITDYRIQGGNWFGILWRYNTAQMGMVSYGDVRDDWHPGVTILDRNNNAWGTILKGCFYPGTLPMDTSALIYYLGFMPGLTIEYATPKLITANVMSGTGTIIPSGIQYPLLPKGQVWYKGRQAFIITANSGQSITDIIIDNSIHYGYQTSPYTLSLSNITQDKNIKVYFGYQVQLVQRGISINAIDYPEGTQYFPNGATVSFDIEPLYTGSTIAKITIQDKDNPSASFSIPIQNAGTSQTITLGNGSLPAPFDAPLNMNYKLTAEANIPIYVSAGPHGTITNEGLNFYAFNSSTFILITPDTLYTFEQISVDSINKIDAYGNSLDPNLVIVKSPDQTATYTFNNITIPRYINATFEKIDGVDDTQPAIGTGFEVSNITPNPVLNEIRMTLKINAGVTLNFELFDINGRKVTTIYNQRKLEPGNFEISIPTEKLATGEYIIKIGNGKRFVVKIFSVLN